MLLRLFVPLFLLTAVGCGSDTTAVAQTTATGFVPTIATLAEDQLQGSKVVVDHNGPGLLREIFLRFERNPDNVLQASIDGVVLINEDLASIEQLIVDPIRGVPAGPYIQASSFPDAVALRVVWPEPVEFGIRLLVTFRRLGSDPPTSVAAYVFYDR